MPNFEQKGQKPTEAQQPNSEQQVPDERYSRLVDVNQMQEVASHFIDYSSWKTQNATGLEKKGAERKFDEFSAVHDSLKPYLAKNMSGQKLLDNINNRLDSLNQRLGQAQDKEDYDRLFKQVKGLETAIRFVDNEVRHPTTPEELERMNQNLVTEKAKVSKPEAKPSVFSETVALPPRVEQPANVAQDPQRADIISPILSTQPESILQAPVIENDGGFFVKSSRDGVAEISRQIVDDETAKKFIPDLRIALKKLNYHEKQAGLELTKSEFISEKRKESWEMSPLEFIDSAEQGVVPARSASGEPVVNELNDIYDVAADQKPLSVVNIEWQKRPEISEMIDDGRITVYEVDTSPPKRNFFQRQIKSLLILPGNLSDEDKNDTIARFKSLYSDKVDRFSPFGYFLMGKMLGYDTEDINGYILEQFRANKFPRKAYPNIESVIANIKENSPKLSEFLPKYKE